MTAEEKAKELFYKIYKVNNPMGNYPMCFNTAKQCALIAVNEISKAVESDWSFMERKQIFWQEVKIEIEKL